MLVKIFSLTLMIVFGYCALFAQASPKSVPEESWEYLIITLSTFTDKEDLKVSDKWLGRRQGKLGFYQDALTQNEFDRIGKLGWELVGILPVNLNDQPSFSYSKFIFKRKSDAARSEREAEELKKLTNELRNSNSINTTNTESLIELDQTEIVAQKKEVAVKAESRLEKSLKNVGVNSITSLQTRYYSNNSKQTYAEIIIDGSSALLKDGNKYRLSEAKKYVRQIASELFNKLRLKQVSPNEDFYDEYGRFNYGGEVFIKVSLVINYNGKSQNVSNGYINGNWAEPSKL